MKKTVVLMASPRLQSNTDILANKVIDGLRSVGSAEDTIEKIDLVELQEFVCCACGQQPRSPTHQLPLALAGPLPRRHEAPSATD